MVAGEDADQDCWFVDHYWTSILVGHWSLLGLGLVTFGRSLLRLRMVGYCISQSLSSWVIAGCSFRASLLAVASCWTMITSDHQWQQGLTSHIIINDPQWQQVNDSLIINIIDSSNDQRKRFIINNIGLRSNNKDQPFTQITYNKQ